jgi:NADPH-dependent curcumin reductase CurA
MSMPVNSSWVYSHAPTVTSSSAEIYELISKGEISPLGEGMLLARTAYISVMPLSKADLELPGNNSGAEEMGLPPRTKIGQSPHCDSVLEVVESTSADYKKGDLVSHFGSVSAYQVLHADGTGSRSGRPPRILPPGFPPEQWLSIMTPGTGVTSYLAVEDTDCGKVDEPYDQKTVLITSAAGTVGLVAGQLYKNKGCRVIGVTSTKEKADRLLDFGFDAAIAYKTDDLSGRLKDLAPGGIDLIFDNVGAAQLDTAMRHMKARGKVLIVGCIAEMEGFISGDLHGCKSYVLLPAKEITMAGFMVPAHLHRLPEAFGQLMSMVQQGKLKSAETVVKGPFSEWAACLDKMMHGISFGRMVLQVEAP